MFVASLSARVSSDISGGIILIDISTRDRKIAADTVVGSIEIRRYNADIIAVITML